MVFTTEDLEEKLRVANRSIFEMEAKNNDIAKKSDLEYKRLIHIKGFLELQIELQTLIDQV